MPEQKVVEQEVVEQEVDFEFNHKFDEYFTVVRVKLNSKKTKLRDILEKGVEILNRGYVKGFGPVLPQIEDVSYSITGPNSDVKVKVNGISKMTVNRIKSAKLNECFCDFLEKNMQSLYNAIIDPESANHSTGLRFTLKNNPKYDHDNPKWADDDDDDD